MTYLHIRVNDVLEPQDAVWWDIHHGHLCKRDLCAANHVTESRFEWDAIYTRDSIKREGQAGCPDGTGPHAPGAEPVEVSN